MRNSIVRALATGAAAALLAGGAAVTATSTAFAAPAQHPTAASAQGGSTPSPTPTPHPSMSNKQCAEIKAHTMTITHEGKSYKLWISSQKVCFMK
ncbi:hypothetical protein ACI2L4_03635 [Streptomyces sparsogenes]|uniref:hypothetical protein n=1 Tax=Streptomyces sparsogenes TaxID=67365 RepID=UPI0033C55242